MVMRFPLPALLSVLLAVPSLYGAPGTTASVADIAAMAGAVLLARRWRESRFVRERWPIWLALAVLAIILTGYLTYHAPDWLIFADLG